MSSRLDPSELLKEAQLGCPLRLSESLRRHGESSVDCTSPSGQTALWLSVERGEVSTASCLIRAGADVNRTYSSRRSPLILAAERGNAYMIRLLVQSGSSLNLCDSFGLSALMTAADNGSADCVRSLLDAGAELHHRDTRGKTAVMMAVERGHAHVLNLLLKAGGSANDKDFKALSPLMIAVICRHCDCVAVLARAGACVDEQDKKGETALFLSVRRDFDCLKALLDCGANQNIPNAKGVYPLMEAAASGCEETMKALIKSGANLDVRDMQGATALLWAARRGRLSNITDLVRYGARTDIQDHMGITAAMIATEVSSECLIALESCAPQWLNLQCNQGRSALMYAAISSNVDCVKILLRLGASVDLQDKKGLTALMSASTMSRPTFKGAFRENGVTVLRSTPAISLPPDKGTFIEVHQASGELEDRLTILRELLGAGAGLEVPDRLGRTAVMHAAASGDVPVSMVECLTSAGAKTDLTGSELGKTALMLAASAGNQSCMQHLIMLGADVNAVATPDGTTALMHAIQSKCVSNLDKVDCCKLLLRSGAHVNARCKEQKTALMVLAETCTDPVLLDFLLNHGADPTLLDAKGRSAFDLAINSRDCQALPLLDTLVKSDMKVGWNTFSRLILSPSYSNTLRKAIAHGLLPVAPKHVQGKLPPHSFLCAALLLERTEVALYFLACGFLNINDLTLSAAHPEFRLTILSYQSRYGKDGNPLQDLNREPWPLVKLCLVQVSTLLGPSPGRRERVISTRLPPMLQRHLLFQTSSARLCASQWPRCEPCLSPTQYEHLPRPRPLIDHWPVGRDLTRCNCDHCDGEGFAFV